MIFLEDDTIWILTAQYPGQEVQLVSPYASHERLHQDAEKMLQTLQDQAGKEDSPILWLPEFSCASMKVVA